jgi:CheY-like chemotaxis protein
MSDSKRRYDEDDLRMAEALADRASTAIERASLFAAAESAREDALRASRTKDDFLAMLGHELRNPLSPILTAVELMRLSPEKSHEREFEVITRQVRYMTRLVDDLLDVSRIACGKIDIELEAVAVDRVVQEALDVAISAKERGERQIHTHVAPDLVVLGDPLRLAQVVANLVSNAVKYSEPGDHIWVEAERGEEPDTIEIRVRDSGIGISPQMMGQIFELFVQEPQALDRARGGLGVGLALVRGLVNLHGGTVQAKSDGQGKGAEFLVQLKAHHGSCPRRSDPDHTETSSAGLRVLVVDDNTDALTLLSKLLEHLGHTVQAAASPREALELAREAPPAVALLDVGLPDMDGFELGRQLRAQPGCERTRLVALTGYGLPSDRERSALAGFEQHLLKPVTSAVLQRTLAGRPPPDSELAP